MERMTNIIAAISGKMIINHHRKFDDMPVPRLPSGDINHWQQKASDDNIAKAVEILYTAYLLDALRSIVLLHKFEGMNLNHLSAELDNSRVKHRERSCG